MPRVLLISLPLVGSLLACMPSGEVELPPLVAYAADGLPQNSAGKPIRVWHKDKRTTVAVSPELYARLCAECEAPRNPSALTLQTQKVLCLTYAEYHRDLSTNRASKITKKIKAMGDGICSGQGPEPCRADVTADDRYQVQPFCDQGGTCYCTNFDRIVKGEGPYKEFALSDYTSPEADRKFADTYGKVLAPRGQACKPTVQTEYHGQGGHGRGWYQKDDYGATTWQGVLAKVPDPTYQGLAPCTLPYAENASDTQNTSTEAPVNQEAVEEGSASHAPVSVAREAECMVCESEEGCGCWRSRSDGSSPEGHCEVRGPCQEQLGSHYAYYFGRTSAPATNPSSESTANRPAQHDPASSSEPDEGKGDQSSSGVRSGSPSATAEQCDGVERCNGQDDDCDPSTVDGSDDEGLFEPCALPVPQGAMLVTAGTATQPGSLICQGGELVCVGETERVEFEQVVATSQEQGSSGAADDAAGGCPLQSRISTGHLGGASWVLALLLWIRLSRVRRRR